MIDRHDQEYVYLRVLIKLQEDVLNLWLKENGLKLKKYEQGQDAEQNQVDRYGRFDAAAQREKEMRELKQI